MRKVIQASEICSYIPDGATLFFTGITMGNVPEESIVEIEKSFLETGHPRDLTLYTASAMGDRNTRGLNHISYPGLLKRVVAGHLVNCGDNMVRLCREEKAEVYNFPQGVLSTMPRYIAAKKPGVITKVGLKTMMDPRYDGGKMNKTAREDLVELVNLCGEEWLLYKCPKVDVAIIRGTVADERGNISIYKEGYQLDQLALAQAARASGGVVICQVENIVRAGTIKPKEVKVPGVLVDYVYVGKPEYHWQTSATFYNPVFSGEISVPLKSIPPERLSVRKVIVRRAAMELCPGDIVNLGVGTPESISSVAAEEGVGDLFTLTTEAGGIGGIPAVGHDFGCCWNAEATVDMSAQFDMYDGGCLDYGALGFLQCDPTGVVNASMRNGDSIGVGGFMNVAGGAKRIVFTATFTGGIAKQDKPEFDLSNGKLVITKEGNMKRFVRQVEQFTFNGQETLSRGKQVTFVTERCVFRLTTEGLMLTEIAPGIDLQKDILDLMEFEPIISPELKLMDAGLFREKWGGLKAIMDEKRVAMGL